MTDTSETNITDAEPAAREPKVDPRDLARSVAIDVAEEPEQVGDVVDAIDMGDGVTDFRIAAHIRGYEGWQWSVTLYHDEELDHWTVNESSLIPTSDALMPPAWVPWKDRLEPTDLAPTDSIGTDPDDPRLEDGFRRTGRVDADGVEGVAGETTAEDGDAGSAGADGSAKAAETSGAETAADSPAPSVTGGGEDDGDGASDDGAVSAAPVDSEEDVDEAVEEFDLSRRHVLSPLGRAQTAKRWYEGPRGPKAMSTKTAAGNLCSTCGFFVPLKGELNLMFGVCANKWSPDDGRVVSLDHGCGEHSEIEPPEPSRLWVQSKPAFDDLHIDIIAQRPREDRAQVEILEAQDAADDEPAEPVDDADGTVSVENPDDGGADGVTPDKTDVVDTQVGADVDDDSADGPAGTVETEENDADDVDAPADMDDMGDVDDEDDLADATEQDIEENTEIDADSEDVAENTVPEDGPELESVVTLDVPSDMDDTDDPIDPVDADDADDQSVPEPEPADGKTADAEDAVDDTDGADDTDASEGESTAPEGE